MLTFLQIAMKELRQKALIEKTTAQRNMFESEKSLKGKMKSGAKTTQKDFKMQEAKAKDDAKEAAKDPKKDGAAADEISNKNLVAQKREAKAKEDELKDLNSAPPTETTTVELGAGSPTSDASNNVTVPSQASEKSPQKDTCDKAGFGIVSICRMAGDESKACQGAKSAFSEHCTAAGKEVVSVTENCENASDGAESICKLTGGEHKACKGAKDAFAEHCGSAVIEGASQQVKAIKKDAAKQLAGKLERLNKRTAGKVKVLKAQMEAVTSSAAKEKIAAKIEKIEAKAAKKLVAKARRVQRRAARKMDAKVGTAIAAAKKDKPKVGTKKRLDDALKKKGEKQQSKLEKLHLELDAAERDKTKRKIKRQIKDEEDKTKRRLERESNHVARKQIRKRTREAKKKANTEIELIKTMQRVETSDDRKEELGKKIEEMHDQLKSNVAQLTERIKSDAKQKLQAALTKVVGNSIAEETPKKKELQTAVEKMVAKAAKDENLAKRVKMRVSEKVSEVRELDRKKADKEIAKVKAAAQKKLSEVENKLSQKSTEEKDDESDVEKTEEKDDESDVEKTKEKDNAAKTEEKDDVKKTEGKDEEENEPKEQKGTHVYLKKGSGLHKNASKEKEAVKENDRIIKDLEDKKQSTSDPKKKALLEGQIEEQEKVASAMQEDYYHKTGPVPAHLKREAEAELKVAAHKAAEPPNGEEGHGDPKKGVPHESMDAFKNVLVPAAVHAAAPKVAELKHKKQTAEHLKNSRKATKAATNQEVLQAQVNAAKRMSKTVQDKVSGANDSTSRER